jgi:hypothetical protein
MNLLSSFTIILQNLNTSCNTEATVETSHMAGCRMPLKSSVQVMLVGFEPDMRPILTATESRELNRRSVV